MSWIEKMTDSDWFNKDSMIWFRVLFLILMLITVVILGIFVIPVYILVIHIIPNSVIMLWYWARGDTNETDESKMQRLWSRMDNSGDSPQM